MIAMQSSTPARRATMTPPPATMIRQKPQQQHQQQHQHQQQQRRRTRSIPIARGPKMNQCYYDSSSSSSSSFLSSAFTCNYDEMMRHADYQDYIFYQRILCGMIRKQEMTYDSTLRYINQSLMDHIVHTRHDVTWPEHNHSSALESTIRPFDDEEELMFDLEL